MKREQQSDRIITNITVKENETKASNPMRSRKNEKQWGWSILKVLWERVLRQRRKKSQQEGVVTSSSESEELLTTENRPMDLQMGRSLLIFEQFQNSWGRNDSTVKRMNREKVETANRAFSFKKFRVKEREIRQKNEDGKI